MTTFSELAEQSAVYAKEIMHLKADRDALLEALKGIVADIQMLGPLQVAQLHFIVTAANAAIVKTESED